MGAQDNKPKSADDLKSTNPNQSRDPLDYMGDKLLPADVLGDDKRTIEERLEDDLVPTEIDIHKSNETSDTNK